MLRARRRPLLINGYFRKSVDIDVQKTNGELEFELPIQTKLAQYFSHSWVVDALLSRFEIPLERQVPEFCYECGGKNHVADDGLDCLCFDCIEHGDDEFIPVPTGPNLIYEPANGGAAISSRFRKLGYKTVTSDLDAALPSDFRGVDWFSKRAETISSQVDYIVTNPPFCVGAPFVRAALKRCEDTQIKAVCFLLRSTFDEPCSDVSRARSIRWDLLTKRMHGMKHTMQIVMPRISFTNDGGTDNVTTSWFIWERVHENNENDFVKKFTVTPAMRDEFKDNLNGQKRLF